MALTTEQKRERQKWSEVWNWAKQNDDARYFDFVDHMVAAGAIPPPDPWGNGDSAEARRLWEDIQGGIITEQEYLEIVGADFPHEWGVGFDHDGDGPSGEGDTENTGQTTDEETGFTQGGVETTDYGDGTIVSGLPMEFQNMRRALISLFMGTMAEAMGGSERLGNLPFFGDFMNNLTGAFPGQEEGADPDAESPLPRDEGGVPRTGDTDRRSGPRDGDGPPERGGPGDTGRTATRRNEAAMTMPSPDLGNMVMENPFEMEPQRTPQVSPPPAAVPGPQDPMSQLEMEDPMSDPRLADPTAMGQSDPTPMGGSIIDGGLTALAALSSIASIGSQVNSWLSNDPSQTMPMQQPQVQGGGRQQPTQMMFNNPDDGMRMFTELMRMFQTNTQPQGPMPPSAPIQLPQMMPPRTGATPPGPSPYGAGRSTTPYGPSPAGAGYKRHEGPVVNTVGTQDPRQPKNNIDPTLTGRDVFNAGGALSGRGGLYPGGPGDPGGRDPRGGDAFTGPGTTKTDDNIDTGGGGGPGDWLSQWMEGNAFQDFVSAFSLPAYQGPMGASPTAAQRQATDFGERLLESDPFGTQALMEQTMQEMIETGGRFDNSEEFDALEARSERDLERQQAQMNEQFGAKGLRFGTDQARGQAALSADAIERLALQRSQIARESFENAQQRRMQAMTLPEQVRSQQMQSAERLFNMGHQQQLAKERQIQRQMAEWARTQGALFPMMLQFALSGYEGDYVIPDPVDPENM